MAYTSKKRVIAWGAGELAIADPPASGPISSVTWDTDVISLKGSVSIEQEEGDESTVEIDQSDLPVDSYTTTGALTVSFSMPNTNRKWWDTFYNTVSDMTSAYVPAAGEEAIGVKMNTKQVKKMLRITMKRGGTKYIFPNLDWTKLFTMSGEDPALFSISCRVLAAVNESDPDFIVINQMDGSAA